MLMMETRAAGKIALGTESCNCNPPMQEVVAMIARSQPTRETRKLKVSEYEVGSLHILHSVLERCTRNMQCCMRLRIRCCVDCGSTLAHACVIWGIPDNFKLIITLLIVGILKWLFFINFDLCFLVLSVWVEWTRMRMTSAWGERGKRIYMYVGKEHDTHNDSTQYIKWKLLSSFGWWWWLIYSQRQSYKLQVERWELKGSVPDHTRGVWVRCLRASR